MRTKFAVVSDWLARRGVPAALPREEPRDRPAASAPTARVLDRSVPIVLYADEWGGIGGTAGYVLMLARGLRRRGYRVAALCHGAEPMAALREALAAAGVDVYVLPADDERALRGRLRRHRAIVALLRRYPGSILALMMGYFTRGGGVILAGVQAGAGAIVRADLTPPEPPIPRSQQLMLRLKDRFTDLVVVGALENREAFGRELGRSAARIRVIHTGIELERFRPGQGRAQARSAFGYRPEDLVVGSVCRLDDERKGMRQFLEMAARVAAVAPRAHFLVAGDGVLRGALEARARDLGIESRVTFAGWRRDVPMVLAGLDVFVMPSLYEGGPTSVLEAMAMRLPVVASRVGMVPEVVAHRACGLVVPPGDTAALSAATLSLLEDDELRERLGCKAREQAERAFSVERMVDRYLEVFAEALAR